jgi:hypothetical protein
VSETRLKFFVSETGLKFCCVWDRTEILLRLRQVLNFVVSETGLKFCCVWDRTEILLCLRQDLNFVVSETGLKFYVLFSCTLMFQQLNSGDVCFALALNNTRAHVWCTKLLSCFVTARWLPSCFERLTPLYQLPWALKVYNETTHQGKPSYSQCHSHCVWDSAESWNGGQVEWRCTLLLNQDSPLLSEFVS